LKYSSSRGHFVSAANQPFSAPVFVFKTSRPFFDTSDAMVRGTLPATMGQSFSIAKSTSGL
jgi:hypothetical protein